MAVHKPRPAWSFAYLLRGVAQIRAIVIKRYTESVWQALCCSAGKFPHAIWEILSGRLVSSALQKTGGALCPPVCARPVSMGAPAPRCMRRAFASGTG